MDRPELRLSPCRAERSDQRGKQSRVATVDLFFESTVGLSIRKSGVATVDLFFESTVGLSTRKSLRLAKRHRVARASRPWEGGTARPRWPCYDCADLAAE